MQRKYYRYDYERKADRKAGFIVFPVVNFIVWVGYGFLQTWLNETYPVGEDKPPPIQALILSLPWMINGIILVWTFIFRPEYAVGYITFLGIAIYAVVALSVLVVGGCYIAMGAGLLFSFFGPVAAIVALGLFLMIFVNGLSWLGRSVSEWYEQWQFVYDDPKRERPEYTNPLRPSYLREEELSSKIPDDLIQSSEFWFNQPSEDLDQNDLDKNEK